MGSAGNNRSRLSRIFTPLIFVQRADITGTFQKHFAAIIAPERNRYGEIIWQET